MLILKIGGGKDINIEGIIHDLSRLREQCIIVHGANALRDEIAEKLGTPKKVLTSISGYDSTYSDKTAIDILMMTYAGLRNSRIVELCQRNGINAVGLSGLDGKLVQGKRNQGIKIKDGAKRRIVRDFSGKPKAINRNLLDFLLNNNYLPVICIPIVDENGYAINSENDDIVTILQQTVNAERIVQLIEAPGILRNKDDQNSVIKRLSKEELISLESQSKGRFKRKLLALINLFEFGVNSVIIGDGRIKNPLKLALEEKGTLIA
ncbi:[LysW]-aminoadipate kinase [candidate division KSB1 bacterium]|nr:[LysW]-aminoadipate kinase [candidate division KSB1 bacterium]